MVLDLKREIMEKEGLKPTEVDLSISNAQTSEQFKNESEMISKNSSVVVLRTPLSRRIGVGNNSTAYPVNMPKKASTTKHTLEQLKSISDLSRVDADEEDKIAAMMHQVKDWRINDASITAGHFRLELVMISFIQKLVTIIQNLLPLIFAATNVKAKDIIHQVKGSK